MSSINKNRRASVSFLIERNPAAYQLNGQPRLQPNLVVPGETEWRPGIQLGGMSLPAG